MAVGAIGYLGYGFWKRRRQDDGEDFDPGPLQDILPLR